MPPTPPAGGEQGRAGENGAQQKEHNRRARKNGTSGLPEPNGRVEQPHLIRPRRAGQTKKGPPKTDTSSNTEAAKDNAAAASGPHERALTITSPHLGQRATVPGFKSGTETSWPQ